MIDNWRWEYFSPPEVLSPDGMKMHMRNNLMLQGNALDNLSKFRKTIDLPLFCNHAGLKYRGWRSQVENKRVGGVPNSRHTQGIAFDLNCYKIPLVDFYIYSLLYSIKEIRDNRGKPEHSGFRMIGIYPNKNFMHGDFRSFMVPKENYLVLQNGANRRTTLLYAKDVPKSPGELLTKLKREIGLPNDWSI